MVEIVQHEEWRAIPGYEGRYEASSHGRVRSLTRRDGRGVLHEGIIRKLQVDEKGYRRVTLHRNGRRGLLVHQLVCMTFHGPRLAKMEVRHIDGNNKNNFASNLAWGTASENQFDKVIHGTHQQTRKTECPRGHVLTAPNLVKSIATDGRRDCLACSRGRANAQTARRLGLDLDLKTVCDEHFRKIMAKECLLEEAA